MNFVFTDIFHAVMKIIIIAYMLMLGKQTYFQGEQQTVAVVNIEVLSKFLL